MLAVGENDAREGNAVFVLHGIAYDSERFLARLALRHNVVGAIEVTPVDLVQRHKLLDVERVGAFHLNRLDLLGPDFDVFARALAITSCVSKPRRRSRRITRRASSARRR